MSVVKDLSRKAVSMKWMSIVVVTIVPREGEFTRRRWSRMCRQSATTSSRLSGCSMKVPSELSNCC